MTDHGFIAGMSIIYAIRARHLVKQRNKNIDGNQEALIGRIMRRYMKKVFTVLLLMIIIAGFCSVVLAEEIVVQTAFHLQISDSAGEKLRSRL